MNCAGNADPGRCAITASTGTILCGGGLSAPTGSRLLAIALEDLLGVIEQPNIPGTVNEHPTLAWLPVCGR